jgi:two-component system CheB/CheR fusion protein
VAAPSPHRLGVRRGSPSILSSLPREQDAQRVRALNENVLLRLPIGIVVVDHHYDIQAINGAARRFLSIHSPAIGEDLVHLAQDVPPVQLRQAIDNTFRTGIPTALDEVPMEDLGTGERRYVQIVCHPQRIEGEQGSIESVIVVVSDITRQAQVRQQLEEQFEMTRADLQNARSAGEEEAVRRDQTIGRLMEANRQLLEANQDLTSTNEEFLLSAEEAQAFTEEVETLNEELQATNEELETLNEELQATIEELNTTNDDLHACSVELQDLAQASEQARARLEAILVSMGDAVVQVDSAANPVLTNAAYERMFGVGGVRLVPGDESGRILSADATSLRRAARGESFSMEFTIRVEDGSFRWFEANGQPIRSAEGVQAGGVVVIRDITERSLRRLQEQFIARASHELRTPLTPMRVALQRLVGQVRDQSEDAPERRYAETALAQLDRLSRLVDELLDVSRLQSGKYRLEVHPVSLNELLPSIARTAQLMTEKQTIQLALPDAPLVVSADPQRLEQIMLNLLSNAIAYAPNANHIDVRLRQVGTEAEIQVQDYGRGIPAEQLPYLFTQFYQGQQPAQAVRPGLGLGLFIVHEIVTAHGGRIDVASAVGQGTTFTIWLPLRGSGQAPGNGPQGEGEPQGSEPRRKRRG